MATAGTFLSRSTFTFADYLTKYEEQWNPDPRGRIVKLKDYQLQGLDDDERTLYTTWNVSYARLEADDELAARFLKLLAYFDHQQLWYELLSAGLDQHSNIGFHEIFKSSATLDSVATTLVDYGFLEWNIMSQSWSMHACVHDWTLAVLNKSIEAAHYWYAFDCVTAQIRQIKWRDLGHIPYARLAPHAAWLVSHGLYQGKMADEISVERCHLASRAAELLLQQSQAGAGERMSRWALQGYEKALGLDSKVTLTAVYNLGVFCTSERKTQEAETLFKRALLGQEEAWGPDHSTTLKTVNQLGCLYSAQSRLEEAERIFLRALQGYGKVKGPDHASTLDAVFNLATVYQSQGRMEDAEDLYLRSSRGLKQLPLSSAKTFRTVDKLCRVYAKFGRLSDMTAIISEWGPRRSVLFGFLGRVLLRSSDDAEAQIAFGCELIVQNGLIVFANVRCDRCGCYPIRAPGRAVCRRCEDIDLCPSCLIEHQAGIGELSTCVDHPFFEVDAIELLGEAQKAAWLEQLALRYPRQEEDSNKVPRA